MEKMTGDAVADADAGGSCGDRIHEPQVNCGGNDKSAVDLFYDKLRKLNETSGLSFLINFRETKLDLYGLYNEVTQRQGFYQVTKTGKWKDVAAAVNVPELVDISAAQLQNIYETLLLQYELMYSLKIPDEGNKWPERNSLGFSSSGAALNSSTGKRKHCDDSPFSSSDSGDTDGKGDNQKYNNDAGEGGSGNVAVHQNSALITSSNTKESTEYPDAPVKPRTAYQIFLRLETHRLKMFHGRTSNSYNLRVMATERWKSLTEKDKQPYIEATKMDKERYDKDMVIYEQLVFSQYAKRWKPNGNKALSKPSFPESAEADEVYRVSSEANGEDLISPDASMVELAVEAMKNAQSTDSMFQIDWGCGSSDMDS